MVGVGLPLWSLPEEELSMKDKFHRYDKRHPEVWRLFCKFADQAFHAGRKRIGHWLLLNRIRWEYYIEKDADEEFTIPNGYIAHYARKYVTEFPQHADLFVLRRLKDPRDAWSGIDD